MSRTDATPHAVELTTRMDDVGLKMIAKACQAILGRFYASAARNEELTSAYRVAIGELDSVLAQLAKIFKDGKSPTQFHVENLPDRVRKAFFAALRGKSGLGDLVDMWGAFQKEIGPALEPTLF